MDGEQYRHLAEMRKIHERRLRTLERQAASLGHYADASVLMQIEDLKTSIEEIDRQLVEHPRSASKSTIKDTDERTFTSKRTIIDDVPLLGYLGPLLQVLFQIGTTIRSFLGQTDDKLQIDQYSTLNLSELEQTLYKIAHDVVLNMDLVGAKIETVDHDNITLRSRAYFINPDFLGVGLELSAQERINECERQVKSIERTMSHIVGKSVSLKGPDAKLDLNDERASENLGFRAFQLTGDQDVLIETELFNAFLPGLPEKARSAMRSLQNRLGVKEIAAIPLSTGIASAHPRFIGTLLVAASRHFSEGDKLELKKYSSRASQSVFSDQVISSLQASEYRENLVFSATEQGSSQNLQGRINSLIAQHWQNYHNMELQKAKYEDIPSELLQAMDAERGTIEQLRRQLRELNP